MRQALSRERRQRRMTRMTRNCQSPSNSCPKRWAVGVLPGNWAAQWDGKTQQNFVCMPLQVEWLHSRASVWQSQQPDAGLRFLLCCSVQHNFSVSAWKRVL